MNNINYHYIGKCLETYKDIKKYVQDIPDGYTASETGLRRLCRFYNDYTLSVATEYNLNLRELFARYILGKAQHEYADKCQCIEWPSIEDITNKLIITHSDEDHEDFNDECNYPELTICPAVLVKADTGKRDADGKVVFELIRLPSITVHTRVLYSDDDVHTVETKSDYLFVLRYYENKIYVYDKEYYEITTIDNYVNSTLDIIRMRILDPLDFNKEW